MQLYQSHQLLLFFLLSLSPTHLSVTLFSFSVIPAELFNNINSQYAFGMLCIANETCNTLKFTLMINKLTTDNKK